MGITFTRATISNPREPRDRFIELEFLIDTGAIYSVVPRTVARRLGLRRLDREQFTLADGTRRHFSNLGTGAARRRVLGPPSVTPLLRALTLESLGLMVNPVTR